MRDKSGIFALKNKRHFFMKTFQAIQLLKQAGLWKYCLVLFKRAETLDNYCSIYELVQREKAKGKYGYIPRSLHLTEVQKLLPQPSNTYEGWDVQPIKWVIQEMEREVYVL